MTRLPSQAPQQRWKRDIAYLYGLSPKLYNALWSEQRGMCAICHAMGPLVVDHDHVTLLVRGLLCDTCNRGIGLLGDCAWRTGQAALYLTDRSNFV